MTGKWLRRTLTLAGCLAALALYACGSSSVVSALTPARFIAFGDGFSDLGQTGTRYTVNDSAPTLWAEQVATRYQRTLTARAKGGLGYAQGNARISQSPDAAGVSTTPTLVQQIDAFLAQNTLAQDDVVIINAGISDMLVNMRNFTTPEALNTAMVQAATDMAQQIHRLVNAGAKHVLVASLYDTSKSPWGKAQPAQKTQAISEATLKFNNALLVGINELGSSVLYVDSAYYFNLLIASPSGYGLTNSTQAVCTSVDAGPGIGIGNNQVNSALCTPNTIVPNADYQKYAFADSVYFTPAAHIMFGNYAYEKFRGRW